MTVTTFPVWRVAIGSLCLMGIMSLASITDSVRPLTALTAPNRIDENVFLDTVRSAR